MRTVMAVRILVMTVRIFTDHRNAGGDINLWLQTEAVRINL